MGMGWTSGALIARSNGQSQLWTGRHLSRNRPNDGQEVEDEDEGEVLLCFLLWPLRGLLGCQNNPMCL